MADSLPTMHRLRRLVTAPARLWRYLAVPPGGAYRERYEAMSDDEKAERQARSARRNGFVFAFVPLKPPKRKL
jgi:hypothetical protein